MPARESLYDHVVKAVAVLFIAWLSITVNDIGKDLEVIKAQFESKTQVIHERVVDHEGRIRLLEAKK